MHKTTRKSGSVSAIPERIHRGIQANRIRRQARAMPHTDGIPGSAFLQRSRYGDQFVPVARTMDLEQPCDVVTDSEVRNAEVTPD